MFKSILIHSRSLLMLCVVACAALTSSYGDETDKPVLRIEEAMRVWQERWTCISGVGQPLSGRSPNAKRLGQSPAGVFDRPIEWPSRKKDGLNPGYYPAEGFYDEEKQQPNMAAALVAQLRYKISTCLGAAVAPTAGDQGGVILPFDPYWDMLIPDIAGLPYGSASYTSYMVELENGNPVQLLRAPNASRMLKVLHDGQWVHPDLSSEPWLSMIEGSITIENYEQRFKDLVTFLQLPMAINTYSHAINPELQLAELNWTYDFYHPDIYRGCIECMRCSKECIPGTMDVGDINAKLSFSVGGAVDGAAGGISFDLDEPSELFASPRNLDVNMTAAVIPAARPGLANESQTYIITALINGVNQPRQIKIPSGLVDIVPDTSSPDQGYTLYFYDRDHVGSKIDGVFSVHPSGAHTAINIDGSGYGTGTNRLTVTRTVAGSEPEVTAFTYEIASDTWSYTQGTGADQRTRTTQRSWVVGDGSSVGDVYQVVTTTKDINQNTIRKTRRKYKIFHWNASALGVPYTSAGRRYELVEKVVDPEGRALTTRYFYDESDYGSFQINQSRRRLSRIEEPDGSWEEITYDDYARPLVIRTPFEGSQSTGGYRETSYTYDQIDFNSLVEEQTETLHVGGVDVVVGRSWSVRINSDSFTTATREIATSSTARKGDASNLRSSTRTYLTGVNAGRVERSVGVDGLLTLYSYSTDIDGQLTTRVESGVPGYIQDPMAATSVIKGLQTVSIRNVQGKVISRTVTDIETGLVVDSWLANMTDSHGRVVSSLFQDGSEETSVYGCCGLESRTDRSGLVSEYQYDSLGRIEDERAYPEMESTCYSHTRYSYDAEGRLLTTTRYRDGESLDASLPASIVVESRSYNVAGDLESITTLRGTTRFTEVMVDGKLQRTTLYPDQTTRIEIYNASGQLEEVSGTAVAPVKYEYGVDNDGAYTKEIRVGDGGSETEWTKSYQDFAGRPYLTVLADGSRYLSTYYPANDANPARRGKLRSETQPPSSDETGAVGITTLYDYNALGERTVTAVDINQNGVIDYGIGDRITKTESGYASVTHDSISTVVRQHTASVWETESEDSSREVSISQQSVDGQYTWNIVNGQVASSIKNRTSRIDSSVTSVRPDGVKTIQTYKAGRLMSTRSQSGTGEPLQSTTLFYDGYGRLEKSTDAWAGDTIYTYYDDDLIKTVLSPDPDLEQSGEGYDAQLTQYVYDSMGRQRLTIRPDGSRIEYRYNAMGLLWRTFGAGTYPQEMTYDAQGRLLSLATWQSFRDESSFESDAGKAVSTWHYDPVRGWLTFKEYDDGEGTAYSYYPSGQLHTRTWARGVVTTYSYGSDGQLLETDYSDTTPDVSFSYNRLGRLKSTTDAAGVLTRSYTNEGLLDAESYDDSGVLAGVVLDRQYDELLRSNGFVLQREGETISEQSYTYDSASRLERVSSGSFNSTYTYVPNAGHVDTLTHRKWTDTRLSVNYQHDRLGRLTEISSAPSADAAVQAIYRYNAINQRTRLTREDSAFWNYQYDSLGQVVDAAKYDSDEEMLPGFAFGFDYDTIGNRKSVERRNALPAASTEQIFLSNLLNQYEERSVPSLIDITGSASLDADVYVNHSQASRSGELFHYQLTADNTEEPVWADVDVLAVEDGLGLYKKESGNVYVPQTPESYDYDEDGNLTLDGRWSYTWDAENRLIEMETIGSASTVGAPKQKLTFSYDALSRRIAKQVYSWDTGSSTWEMQADIRFLWDGWNLIAELDALSSYAPTKTYAWGLDLSGSIQGAGGVGGLLVIQTASGDYFPAYDGNGNVIALIDATTGIAEAEYEYGAFGELLRKSGEVADENAFRFSTKYTDSETGLLYYGYRYYDPVTGRWASRDPLQEDGGVNLYGFIRNDGVNKLDYIGLLNCRVDCEELKKLLDNPSSLKRKLSRLGYPSKLLDDIVEMGKYGGRLGNAFLSRLLYGDPIKMSHKSGSARHIRRNGVEELFFDFDEPLLSKGFKDVLDSRTNPSSDEEVLEWIGDSLVDKYANVKTLDDYRKAENDAMWRRSTVIAHELGHEFLDSIDPYNVIVVDHAIQRALRSSGLTETISQSYNGRSLFPTISDEEFYQYPGLAVYGGASQQISAKTWWWTLDKTFDKAIEFIDEWGCE